MSPVISDSLKCLFSPVLLIGVQKVDVCENWFVEQMDVGRTCIANKWSQLDQILSNKQIQFRSAPLKKIFQFSICCEGQQSPTIIGQFSLINYVNEVMVHHQFLDGVFFRIQKLILGFVRLVRNLEPNICFCLQVSRTNGFCSALCIQLLLVSCVEITMKTRLVL